MSKKFLTNLDLNKNQIQNAVVQPLASAPANPAQYQIYTNSTDGVIYQYVGSAWRPVGVVYNQAGSTGAVIVGLDSTGKVTTKNVIDLTLTGYSPVDAGYVTEDMTMQAAIAALDEAVKNAVAGGGEINQNAWSKVTVKQQSTSVEAVQGAAADVTLSADAKTDTLTMASGNKWVDIDGDGKEVTFGHSLSGVAAGTFGSAKSVPAITVDEAGHVTSVQDNAITPDAIGADVAGAAAAVLGDAGDASTEATVYGARKLAQEAKDAADAAQGSADDKVASVTAAENGGISIGGTATEPTVGIKLDPNEENAASLGAAGLMVEQDKYNLVKLETAEAGFIASYQLTKNGAVVGATINIPKDYLVKSADLKVSAGDGDPSGFPAGTTYIDFVVNTYDTESGSGTESHIYLDVQKLVDVYKAGQGINIAEDNTISVKVVAANGLSVDEAGIKMALASADAAGAMSAGDFTKLSGIDEAATANTITLNGTATKTPSFYAPAAGGTAGQILVAGGENTAPVWQDAPEAFHKYSETNGAITAAGGAFVWTIAAATHKLSDAAIIVQLYEVATGEQVVADVAVNQTTRNVTITINDTAGAGTLAAGTYRAVLFG